MSYIYIHIHTYNNIYLFFYVIQFQFIFYDNDNSFLSSVWSTEGCRVEWTNATHTGCQCTHLTNFALLMDVHSVPLSAANALALNIITFIGCGISVIALLASVIVFQCVGGMKVFLYYYYDFLIVQF